MTESQPKKRWSPAAWLVLGVCSLGIGFWWYYHLAFRDVARHAGRRHSGLMFLALVPMVGPFFFIAYLRAEHGALDAAMTAAGQTDAFGASEHVMFWWWTYGIVLVASIPVGLATRPEFGLATAGGLLLLGAVVSVAKLAPTVDRYWQRLA